MQRTTTAALSLSLLAMTPICDLLQSAAAQPHARVAVDEIARSMRAFLGKQFLQ